MKQLEKLLSIYELISDMRTLTPDAKLSQIHAVDDVDPSIDRHQLAFIFEILANDHKVIKIHTKPDYKTEFHYRYSINDNFDEVYNRVYGQAKFGIKSLGGLELLKVYDVALDIAGQLSLTTKSEVKIPALPPVVRFSQLMPADSISLRDRYLQYRWTACEFLKEYGVISVFDFVDSGTHRWDGEIWVSVNRPAFDRALAQIRSEYQTATGKSTTPKAEPQPTQSYNDELEYDDEHGKVTYKGQPKELFIPSSLEGFLMYRVTNADGARINSADVSNEFEAKHPELDKDVTTKMLTNTKNRINDKLNKAFGITDEPVKYGREQFWLADKYCSAKSFDKKARSGK